MKRLLTITAILVCTFVNAQITPSPTQFNYGIKTDSIWAVNDTVHVNDPFVYPDKIQQLETIADLENYTGESTTVFVKDTLRGGIFNYEASGLTADDGTVFSAQNGGFWERQFKEKITPEFFGAIGNGMVNDSLAFSKLTDYVNNRGGNVYVSCRPEATYLVHGADAGFDIGGEDVFENYDIQFNHVEDMIFDGNGATFTGRMRISFNGDSGIDGDYSQAIKNVTIRNIRFIEPDGFDGYCVRGIQIVFGENILVENIYKNAPSGTAFQFQYLRNSVIRDIWNEGAKDSAEQFGAIGLLLHLSNTCVLDNIFLIDGPFQYGMQIKGGEDNIIRNSYIINSKNGDFTTCIDGFRDRGDSPYKPSVTTSTYPFPDLGWSVADIRRESRRSKYANCYVIDSEFTSSFRSQEASNTEFINCKVVNGTEYGFVASVTKEPDAKERGVLIKGCSVLGGKRAYLIGGTATISYKNATIINSKSDSTSEYGVYLSNVAKYNIDDVEVTNATGVGLYTDSESSGGKVNKVVIGDSESLTQGIYIKHYDYNISNSQSTSTADWPYLLPFLDNDYNNKIDGNRGSGYYLTEDATVHDTYVRRTIPNNSKSVVNVTYRAVTESNVNIFKRKLYMARDAAGVLNYQEYTIGIDENPDGLAGPLFINSGNVIRFRVAGKAATTVKWYLEFDNNVYEMDAVSASTFPTPYTYATQAWVNDSLTIHREQIEALENLSVLLHEQTITSTELQNIGTTPIELIAAPGAGKIIVVERVVAKMEAQTTAYDFTNGLQIVYDTYSDAIADFDNTFTNSMLDAYSSVDGESVPAHTNAGIFIESASNPTTGDGILHLKIYYRIVEF